MKLPVRILPLLLLSIGLSHARAQLTDPGLVLASRVYDEEADCSDAPPVCDALTLQDRTGIHEFLVYGYAADMGGILSADFSLDWPEAWTVLDWAACRAPLEAGDPAIRGDRLFFDLNDCDHWDTPLLRLVIDCPTPGRLRFSDQDAHLCATESQAFAMESYVEVGDFCGRLPRATPCEALACDDLAGSFGTPSLRTVIPQGSVWSDTLSASFRSCGSIPECDGGYNLECDRILSTDAEWMSVELLDSSGRTGRFVVTIDASALGAGEFDGRVYLDRGSSGCCTENCMGVSLDVSPVSPVIQNSWGTLKDRFR